MPTIESKPISPAQPNKAEYGTTELALFDLINTREEFKEKFKEDPPKFNPAVRPKYWFDTTVDLSDPEGEVTYLIVRKVNSVPRLMRTTMPNWEAARVNIPDTPEQGAAGIDSYIHTPRDMPIRELLPNEALFQISPFEFGIMRSDLKAAEDDQAESFTPKDRILLKAIAKTLGVPAI